jgi:ribosomal protein S18 acetylase RimI-like enzyme
MRARWLKKLEGLREQLGRLGLVGVFALRGGQLLARLGLRVRRRRLLACALTPAHTAWEDPASAPRRLAREDLLRRPDRGPLGAGELAHLDRLLADPRLSAWGFIGASEGGPLLAVGWLSLGPPEGTTGLDGAPEGFGADAHAGFLWGDHVAPEARRQGLHQRLIAHRLALLAAAGKTTARTTIDWHNRASRLSYLKAGFRQTGSRTTLRPRRRSG